VSFDYIFYWGNNERRADFKGQLCRVIRHGRMHSVLVEFQNGERLITSERALRRQEPAPTIAYMPAATNDGEREGIGR